MNLSERWGAHGAREEESEGQDQTSWAIRGDAKLVILDEFGWFLVVNTGPGLTPYEGRPTETLYMLEAPDGTREQAYIEPIEVAGYFDSVPWAED